MKPLLHPSRSYLPTLALAATLGFASAQAPAPSGDAGADQDQAAAPAKAAKSVLHMADGRVMRVMARAVEDGWEIQRGKEWVLLPAEFVARVATEREIFAEARELERGVKKDDLTGRVAYADWLAEEGLLAESLAEIDEVLARDPDQRAARALLAQREIVVALPRLASDSLDSFLRTAASAGPAVRELAIERLVAATEVPGILERLEQELVVQSPRRRSFATLALRRIFPGQAVKGLIGRAVLDPSDDVRAGAALALRDVGDDGVILPIVRALDSKHDVVRTNAAEALGAIGVAEAVEPLVGHLAALQSGSGGRRPHAHISVLTQMAYVQDFDVEVAQGAAIADPQINVLTEGFVLDAAVIGTTEYIHVTERATVRRSLAQLTGAKVGKSSQAWLDWWTEHGEEWKAARRPQGTASTPGSLDE
jgi:hypothetical protein